MESIVQVLFRLLSIFPIKVHYRIGKILAYLVSHSKNQLHDKTVNNVELCFAELNDIEKQSLVRQALLHACYAFAELASLWCKPVDQLLAMISEQQICDEFRQSKCGRIVIAPHLGSWELLNLWLSRETELLTLYQPQAAKGLDRFMKNSRSRGGATLLPADVSGVRQILRGLKAGKTAMILPDQRPGQRNARVKARFFGKSAYTTPLVHSLHEKTASDVFIAVVYRQEAPGQFGLRIEKLDGANIGAAQFDSVQYMNDEIERLARCYLEQYQWIYRRFLTSEYRAIKSKQIP